jgi:hypothetical protein
MVLGCSHLVCLSHGATSLFSHARVICHKHGNVHQVRSLPLVTQEELA